MTGAASRSSHVHQPRARGCFFTRFFFHNVNYHWYLLIPTDLCVLLKEFDLLLAKEFRISYAKAELGLFRSKLVNPMEFVQILYEMDGHMIRSLFGSNMVHFLCLLQGLGLVPQVI